MMALPVFFFVPAVVFLVIVAPIWLLLHYWAQIRSNKGLSVEDQHQLDAALALAEQLEQRVRSLETILDDQQPDWRRHHDSASDDNWRQTNQKEPHG